MNSPLSNDYNEYTITIIIIVRMTITHNYKMLSSYLMLLSTHLSRYDVLF